MDNYRQFTFIVPVNTFYLLHFITKRFFYFYFLDMVEMPGAASKNSICYNIPKRLLLYSCASFTNTSWPIHLFLNLCLGKRRLSLIILLKSSFFKNIYNNGLFRLTKSMDCLLDDQYYVIETGLFDSKKKTGFIHQLQFVETVD